MDKNAVAFIGIVIILIFIYARELQIDKKSPIFNREYERHQELKKKEEARLKMLSRLENPVDKMKKSLPPIDALYNPNLPEPKNFRPRWTFPETVPSDFLSVVSKRPYLSMNPPYSNYPILI